MTRFDKGRMTLVLGARPVPTVAVLEKQFIDFWCTMRGNLYDKDRRGQLSHSERSCAKRLASKAFDRRCREVGLGSVEDKKLPGLLALIRDGGRLLGPSRMDDVHRLAADLHAGYLMSVLVISDLHLERWPMAKRDPVLAVPKDLLVSVEGLIVARDLSNKLKVWWPYMIQLLTQYVPAERVYLVAGNHNYPEQVESGRATGILLRGLLEART